MQTLQGLRISCQQMTLPQCLWRGRRRCPNEVPGHRGWSVRGGGPHYVICSPLLLWPLEGWKALTSLVHTGDSKSHSSRGFYFVPGRLWRDEVPLVGIQVGV